MTKSSPAATDHWAVSARTHGAIVTAGVTLPSIEMALLGIPPGFTPAEIENWLRDLAGVAIETSRTDERERPIPPLLHHALTGLLFSQTELWSHTGHPLPCAAVFVHGPQGVAFGWTGRARVVLLVNGEPHEPQWVIVRDEAGQEAMSAAMPSDSHVLLTLEYWPTDEGSALAPASLDAEYGQSLADAPAGGRPAAAPAGQGARPAVPPSPAATAPPPVPSPPAPSVVARPAQAAAPQPASPQIELPVQQPGLAHDPTGMRLEEGEAEQRLPNTRNPSSSTFAMPRLPGTDPSEGEDAPGPGERRVSGERDEFEGDEDAGDEPGHPVGRWLARLMGGFTKKRQEAEARSTERAAERSDERPPAAAPRRESAPSLGSHAVPAGRTPPLRVEPAHLEGPPLSSADIEEPHALPLELGGLQRPAAKPAPPGPSGRGFAPAGLGEILGKPAGPGAGAAREPKPGPVSTQRSQEPGRPTPGARGGPPAKEGVAGKPPPGTRAGAPSKGSAPPSERASTPYPLLDVNPPAGLSRGPIQIEREPVGADAGFGIPKLPPRDAPKTPRGQAVDPPKAQPREAQAEPPVPRRGPVPPPVLTTPGPREAAVPEPPTEFLEQFAASMRVDPAIEPAPPEPPAREAARPPEAKRTLGPPPLPSARRAAAQAQRGVIPPVPGTSAPSTPAGSGAKARVAPAAPAPAGGQTARPAEPSIRPAAGSASSPAPAPVLHTPSAAAPVPVAESEMSTLLRELPLPATGEEGEIPEGVLVARPSRPRPPGARSRLRGQWPDLDALEESPPPLWRRWWVAGLLVALLLGIGWIVGNSQAPDNDVHATPMTRVLRSFGMGGARFTANIDSDPPGAWITVDGKELGRQTPATLELLPGEHALTLSMPDLGQVKTQVRGKRGQKVKVSEALHGSLDVVASDPALPVQLSLDGAAQGYLPVHVAKLPPGLHELQFSGPRMQPWAQNVSVGIRQNTRVVSKPMLSPATGVVQVQAQMNDENGAAPLSGASVYVDGELRGTTPATVELPRGPHSLRVQFEGTVAPIQVIDLPGGNRRFAMFQFGLDSDLPPLKLQGSSANLLGRKPAVISASLDGLEADDLREAWLHLRTPEGLWTRYEMTIEAGERGAVLTVNFPVSLFNGEERAYWYLSAATKQGDEFFTDMQHSGR